MIAKKEKLNFNKVFKVFEKNYTEVPLEIFKDPYEILISTVMSARTNDDTTLPAAKRLFKRAPDIKTLSELNIKAIQKLIYPVGFYKIKAKNIQKLSEIISNQHKGIVPSSKEELVKLPGVGIKTANLTLNRAFKVPAIAVDTHVHKISNWLGWINTKKPEESLKELEKIVPKKYWADMNRLFVGIGRRFRTETKIKYFLKENGLID